MRSMFFFSQKFVEALNYTQFIIELKSISIETAVFPTFKPEIIQKIPLLWLQL